MGAATLGVVVTALGGAAEGFFLRWCAAKASIMAGSRLASWAVDPFCVVNNKHNNAKQTMRIHNYQQIIQYNYKQMPQI